MSDYRFIHTKNSVCCSFPAKLGFVDRVCDQVKYLLKKNGLDRLDFDVELLVREILNNCILHGCNLNVRKEVFMQCCVNEQDICISVQDQGEGFNWRQYFKSYLSDQTLVNGRGLQIVCLYSDSVKFNNKGNEVQIKKFI